MTNVIELPTYEVVMGKIRSHLKADESISTYGWHVEILKSLGSISALLISGDRREVLAWLELRARVEERGPA